MDSRFNSPSEYGEKLQRQVEAVVAIAGGIDSNNCTVPWVLGLPIAASAHEYVSYTPNPDHCGPACTSYFQKDVTMSDYVNIAFNFVRSRPDIFAVSPPETSCFRGFTFWKFDPLERPKSGGGDYPPKSGNVWSPLGPTKKELQVLKTQLSGPNAVAGGGGDNFWSKFWKNVDKCVDGPHLESRSFCEQVCIGGLCLLCLIIGAVSGLVCRYRKERRRRLRWAGGGSNMVEPLIEESTGEGA